MQSKVGPMIFFSLHRKLADFISDGIKRTRRQLGRLRCEKRETFFAVTTKEHCGTLNFGYCQSFPSFTRSDRRRSSFFTFSSERKVFVRAKFLLLFQRDNGEFSSLSFVRTVDVCMCARARVCVCLALGCRMNQTVQGEKYSPDG